MKIKIDYKTKTVDLIGEGYPECRPYWISFDRFDSFEKLLDWIRHLCEKIWWSSNLTRGLIKAYEEVNKIKIGSVA